MLLKYLEFRTLGSRKKHSTYTFIKIIIRLFLILPQTTNYFKDTRKDIFKEFVFKLNLIF